MIGAIIGDIIGSPYEGTRKQIIDFPLFRNFKNGIFVNDFTDDTVLTLAVADAILHKKSYAQNIKGFAIKYPMRGYGGMFRKWKHSESLEPYNSYGNGSGMRVSPVTFAFDTLEEVLEEAKKSAEVTHNHPEGIKGAQAIASAGFLALQGKEKEEIRTYVQETFEYDMDRTIESIKPNYSFSAICQTTVPEAIIAFLDSTDFESAIRLAVSLGGDTDTVAAMAGGIAQAYYKSIPEEMISKSRAVLGEEIWLLVEEFNTKYKVEF